MIDPKSKEFQEKETYCLEDLLTLISFLRSDQGCPWDRAQEHETIEENMLEEAYEAVDAIQCRDDGKLKEELGDVLMQVVFHAQLAQERDAFDFSDIVTTLCQKLISRHTHLFGEDKALTPEEGLDSWTKNKNIERNYNKASELLTDVPRAMPALMRAAKVQKRAAKYGFDWPSPEGAREKMVEELAELEAELSKRPDPSVPSEDQELERRVQSEAGDLLFALVNFLRLNKIEPESALTKTTESFIRRFQLMEEIAEERSVTMSADLDLEAYDSLWEEAKRRERA